MTQVITVNGPVSPEDLGITLPHLHVLMVVESTEQSKLLAASLPASKHTFVDKPITMDILGILRRNCYLNKDFMRLIDVDEMANELRFYKMAGGTSVVDCTMPGQARDPVGLRAVSLATGVNIICTTGWYIASTHPEFVKTSDIDGLCDHIIGELTVGIENTGIRAGMIKVAFSGATPDKHCTGDEEKVLRAAARAQIKTGAGINIHPTLHFGQSRPFDTYVSILKEEGAPLEKCFMSHLDFWCADRKYQESVLEQGVIIGFDQFGIEYYGAPGKYYMPDCMKVEAVVDLVKAGYVNQIVLSNEVAFRIGMRKYGGYGYAHVLENIVPDLRYHGITEKQIHTMLVENPKRLLAF